MATAILSPLPELAFSENTITLRRATAAIRIVPEEYGRSRFGICMHLPAGARIEICGMGFSKRTVQVRSEGFSYFVLLKSVLPDAEA
jgi:hypothetical protein